MPSVNSFRHQEPENEKPPTLIRRRFLKCRGEFYCLPLHPQRSHPPSFLKESPTMRNRRGRLFVKRGKKLLICFCLLLVGCANSDKVENRDYAFDTYYPTPNEIQLAQQRAQRYWAKNSQRFQNSTKYLAVYATSIVQGNVNQGLYSKLINAQTTSNFFETDSSASSHKWEAYRWLQKGLDARHE